MRWVWCLIERFQGCLEVSNKALLNWAVSAGRALLAGYNIRLAVNLKSPVYILRRQVGEAEHSL